jgi:hypothetical protein
VFHAQDANDVVILQDVADVAKARTWFGSDDLKAAMQKSDAGAMEADTKATLTPPLRTCYPRGANQLGSEGHG